MPEYTKTDTKRNITYIITSAREISESKINEVIEVAIKAEGYPPSGSTKLIKVLTPKRKLQSE